MAIPKITLNGSLSGEEITIDIDTAVVLINAYMVIIPNEKRTLPDSLKVLRFHEDLKRVLAKEEKAGIEHIERKTKDALVEDL